MIIVFLGAPGSGKGTQAARLSQRAGVPQISTGDMLRRAVAGGTELGRKAGAVMETGDLVPDDLMIEIIGERIAAADCRDGFLLDGFPRTVAQAQALGRMLAQSGERLDAAVNLQVDEEHVIERMRRRARLEGRTDDNPATIRERLRVYREKTEPLVTWYEREGLLINLDGIGTVEEVGARLDAALAGVGVG